MASPCVLVVEDEALIRMMLADQLTADHFCVVEAENADVAMAMLRDRPEVSAVITDVRMPGTMDGLELARQISTCWPHLKVFITSGHITVGDPNLPPDAVFVPKPYTAGTFAKLLSQALN
ncbi:response regulator [Allosphingosinicella deserti]|uniref:Response regulatory domain-containing protein n=1 Tax=Allosphingosinicella deserti TaxID=2116704 RepID=A0A2P7QZE7_9SPHN|nr:response regulator [Sphingomonas deserti]PSJ43323.1 hypothetical protein C7I55_02820 [Sphingomonas deserti]